MPRLSFFAFLPAICVVVDSLLPAVAQRPVPRGVYHRNEDPAFEIWVPKDFTERKGDAEAVGADTVFSGDSGGAHQISFASRSGFADLATFVTAVKNGLDSQFTSHSVEVHENEKAGGLAAVIIHARDLKGNDRIQSAEALRAGILFPGETVFSIGMYLDKGCAKRAFEQLRWMMSTIKSPGENGLDPFLGSRRMDKATGLSFRPPRGFEAVERSAGDAPVFAAENGEAGMRFRLDPSDRTELAQVLSDRGKGLDRSGPSWTFPHAGSCRLVGAVYREPNDKSKGRVIVAAQFEKSGGCFALEVSGALQAREALIRTAELAAMGLDHVDVVAARAAVERAVPALESARKKRNKDGIKAELAVLARYPFLESAACGMARCITKIDDSSTQLEVAEALAGADCEAILPDLVKDIRYFAGRKQHDVAAALLTALGSVQGPRAVGVLFKFARRGTNAEAAAAIGSLGRYRIRKDRIVKELVSLLDRAESAASKPDQEARERWLVVKPAFRSALKRLTGQPFESADQAKAWLKKH